MQIFVLGGGAWGTALSLAFLERGWDVTLWTFLGEHAHRMALELENREFLPGVALPPSLRITSEFSAAKDADLVVLVVPSQAVRETLVNLKPHLRADATVVCASKGIEQESGHLMTGVIEDVLGGDLARRSVALSGPSFAREVAQRLPTNLVSASLDATSATLVQTVLGGDWLRVYTSLDPIGVEVGGALKNVIAVAAGACDGFGLGSNARAAVITRGIAEMSRFAVALGGEARTLAGLAGVGDLVLTCTGELSRNRALGQKLARGVAVDAALATSLGVAEGYTTAKSAYELGKKLDLDTPIVDAVYSVLHGGLSPKQGMAMLLSRPLHGEWE